MGVLGISGLLFYKYFIKSSGDAAGTSGGSGNESLSSWFKRNVSSLFPAASSSSSNVAQQVKVVS
jgi:hypothetical protein